MKIVPVLCGTIGPIAIGLVCYLLLPQPYVSSFLMGIVAVLSLSVSMLAARVRDPFDVETRMGLDVGSHFPPGLPNKPKHAEMILAARAPLFDECPHLTKSLNLLAFSDFFSWPETARSLVLMPRSMLEPDVGYRQFLPYMLVRQYDIHGDTRFLVYRRTPKVGESRLSGKVSFGFGGHVDATSVVFRQDSTIDLAETLMQSAERERDEELKIKGEPRDYVGLYEFPIVHANIFLTLMHDVHRVHVGLVMIMDIPEGVELECAEPELETLGMMTLEEMRGHQHVMEDWSRHLLQYFMERRA